MDYVSPSIQGSIQLRFRDVCDLAMIYNKAFFVLKWYINREKINPQMNYCFAFENKFGEVWWYASTSPGIDADAFKEKASPGYFDRNLV